MIRSISNKLSRFSIFRLYYLGMNMARSAKTIKLEEGRPQLPYQVKRLRQYSEFARVSTKGINTEIPRHHVFEPRWVYSAMDVILDCERGDIYLDEKTRVYESSNWHPFIPEYSRTRIPERDLPKFLGRQLCYVAGWTYFHFLIENLPSFLAASDNLEISRCLVAKSAPTYVRDALNALGVEVIEVEKFTMVSELVFCGKGPDTGWLHPIDLQMLRMNFSRFFSQGEQGRAIYISRTNSSRSPANELLLEQLMKDIGIEIVHPEDYTFIEQIALFSSAHLVVGVHGAGLANQIWMNPGSRIIEILDINYFNICFESLADVCAHQYTSVHFDSVRSGSDLPVQDIIDKCKEVLRK